MSGYFSSSLWPKHGLLVHGGVLTPSSTKPISSLLLYTFESNFNTYLCINDQGPSLSHHASCFVNNLENDFLVIIGGWTGQLRTNKVCAFNLEKKQWIQLEEDKNGRSRCDSPVGLSGHTATAINSSLICVIGMYTTWLELEGGRGTGGCPAPIFGFLL